MRQIVLHLWFDTQAVEAARWYVSIFDRARITRISSLEGTPSGQVDTVAFELEGVPFSAISAGPYFTLNSSISLMVTCRSPEEVDRLYARLSQGATERMPLGAYPFSKRYVWLADRYGVNWQLACFEAEEVTQKIRPNLLFAGDVCGRATDALAFYRRVFPDASLGYVNDYQPGEAEDARAKINYGELTLPGCQFVVMDHSAGGDEAFNEAFSFMVLCDDQAQIDAYWQALSAVPEAEQCGWLKDRFGVSWQIVPADMADVLASLTGDAKKRYTEAFLQMKKLNVAALREAIR